MGPALSSGDYIVRPPEGRPLRLDVDEVDLPATLVLPAAARGLVLFAHAGAGQRSAAGDWYVGRSLAFARVGTLTVDLVSDGEDAARMIRPLDASILVRRFCAVARWAGSEAGAGPLPVGFFGWDGAVPIALAAAAERPDLLKALVTFGGRPDLAARWLPRLAIPTLLMVGVAPPHAQSLDARAAGVAVDWLVAHLT